MSKGMDKNVSKTGNKTTHPLDHHFSFPTRSGKPLIVAPQRPLERLEPHAKNSNRHVEPLKAIHDAYIGYKPPSHLELLRSIPAQYHPPKRTSHLEPPKAIQVPYLTSPTGIHAPFKFVQTPPHRPKPTFHEMWANYQRDSGINVAYEEYSKDKKLAAYFKTQCSQHPGGRPRFVADIPMPLIVPVNMMRSPPQPGPGHKFRCACFDIHVPFVEKNTQCPVLNNNKTCPVGNKAKRTLIYVPVSNTGPESFKRDFLTTYQADFYSKEQVELEKRVHARRKTRLEEEFMMSESTYKLNFPAHCVQPFKKSENYAREQPLNRNASFEANTSYQIEFANPMGEPAKSAKPKNYLEPKGPIIDGLTTYSVEFIPHCLPEKFVKETSPETLSEIDPHPCAAFDGSSVYKQDFIDRKCSPRKPILPYVTPKPPSFPLDHATTYQTAFEPFYFDNTDNDCKDCI